MLEGYNDKNAYDDNNNNNRQRQILIRKAQLIQKVAIVFCRSVNVILLMYSLTRHIQYKWYLKKWIMEKYKVLKSNDIQLHPGG